LTDRGAVFSPSGERLALGSMQGDVRFVASASGKELGRLQAEKKLPLSLAYSPDGKVFASAGEDGVHLWNAKTHEAIRSLPGAGDEIVKVVLSASNALVVGKKTGQLHSLTGPGPPRELDLPFDILHSSILS